MGFDEQGGNSSFVVTTTNATPTEYTQITIEENNSYWFDVLVIARSSTGTSALWRKMLLLKDVSGTGTIVSSVSDLITPIKDLGALLWSVEFVTTSGFLTINVVGEASTTIEWKIELDFNGYLFS